MHRSMSMQNTLLTLLTQMHTARAAFDQEILRQIQGADQKPPSGNVCPIRSPPKA